MITSRELLQACDALGVEWGYARTHLEMKLEPSIGDLARGTNVTLMIELPVGLVDSGKVRALMVQLEKLA